MTTLTGKTDMKLKGTTSHPTFGLALFGAVAQTSVLLYNWYTNTTAKACISNPYECLVNYKDADPWGRMLIFTMTLCLPLLATGFTRFRQENLPGTY